MGIFDKLMRALGFEEEDATQIEHDEPVKTKKEKKITVNSKFDLKSVKEEEEFEKKLNFYNPKSQVDIEEIAKNLIKGNDAKVDFNEFPESDKIRALDFLYGVIFVLEGKIEKVDKNIYLLKNKGN
jgi:FtsZ-interacting cell division protein YlmF